MTEKESLQKVIEIINSEEKLRSEFLRVAKRTAPVDLDELEKIVGGALYTNGNKIAGLGD